MIVVMIEFTFIVNIVGRVMVRVFGCVCVIVFWLVWEEEERNEEMVIFLFLRNYFKIFGEAGG